MYKTQHTDLPYIMNMVITFDTATADVWQSKYPYF